MVTDATMAILAAFPMTLREEIMIKQVSKLLPVKA